MCLGVQQLYTETLESKMCKFASMCIYDAGITYPNIKYGVMVSNNTMGKHHNFV